MIKFLLYNDDEQEDAYKNMFIKLGALLAPRRWKVPINYGIKDPVT